MSVSAMVSSTVSFQVCYSGTATIDTTAATTIPASANYQPLQGNDALPGSCSVGGILIPGQTSYSYYGIRVKGDTVIEPSRTRR